ncbi:hypothetical protein Ahy_A10g050184 [Arachis hypogaea]|uniref:Uncharacterized protein n=1 Tax=Arachis hypogaea TaxID=3818 RepID=A0A445B8S0_ARAHY|nr:hypothetical protein Ahy_A10g050184 [Arachis hypogaea]
MKFSTRKAIITLIKDYTICKDIDYRVYELELITFYAKCTKYNTTYDRLVNVNMIHKKYCWEIRRYNVIITKHGWQNKKSMKKIYGGWEASYEALLRWFKTMCHKETINTCPI